jgi:hypothetical protein
VSQARDFEEVAPSDGIDHPSGFADVSCTAVAFYKSCGICEQWIKEARVRSNVAGCRAERSRPMPYGSSFKQSSVPPACLARNAGKAQKFNGIPESSWGNPGLVEDQK